MLIQNNFNDKYDKFEQQLKGQAVISISNVTRVNLGYPGLGKGVQYSESNLRVGYATGRYNVADNTGALWVQVEFENPLGSDELYEFGYIYSKDYKIVQMDNKKGAEDLLQKLIQNNKTVLENNLICAGLISKAKKNETHIPQSYVRELQRLQRNLNRRNNKLLNSNFVDVKVSTPQGFNRYSQELQNITNTGIGVAPIVIYIVATFIITALVSYIVYLIFRPDYSESETDLKQSKLLTKALATLTPQEQAEVIADLESQVDKAYVTGKLKGSGMGTLKTVGYAGVGILGVMILGNLFKATKK